MQLSTRLDYLIKRRGSLQDSLQIADLKGTAYGLYYFVVGTGFFIANSVVGALWAYAGSAVAASYCVGTSIAAIVGMIIFLRLK